HRPPPSRWSLARQRDRVLRPGGREDLRGADELAEQRVRPRRSRAELGVELTGHEERVTLELDDLDESAVRRQTREHETLARQRLVVRGVDLVPVAMAFVDDGLAVDLRRAGAWHDVALLRPQAHRAAEVGHVLLFGQQV